MTDKPARSFDITIDIDASQEDVWNALTKADELVRWFPLQAEVTPGAGGSMRWAWGDSWNGVMRIDQWDAPRVLRLVDHHARPYDVNGQPLTDTAAPAASVAVTVTLETVDGRTRLRLVHSGFGSGAAWDDEIDGVSNGWQVELRSLRHYLTRHRGCDRHIAGAQGSSSSLADAWATLMNGRTVAIDAPRLEEGQPYTATLGTGDRLSGRIQLYSPGRDFVGTAVELGDGLFRVGVYPAAGRAGSMLWAASWDSDADRMRALAERFKQLIAGTTVAV